jgi:hypothetical protein
MHILARGIRRVSMKLHLSRPKDVTWFVALVLIVLALLGKLAIVAALTQYDFLLAMAAAVLLLIATMVEGL